MHLLVYIFLSDLLLLYPISYIVFLFFILLRKIFLSFLSSLIYWLFRSLLFNFHVFVGFSSFLLWSLVSYHWGNLLIFWLINYTLWMASETSWKYISQACIHSWLKCLCLQRTYRKSKSKGGREKEGIREYNQGCL